jgi:hypothetical protein
MNILLLAAGADRISLALCTTRGAAHCALAGVIAVGEQQYVELREPQGAVLHRADLPAVPTVAARGRGIELVLAWLRQRNIRVDLVAHRVEHHAEHDHVLRLAPDRVSTMAEFESCKAAVYSIEAVTALAGEMPQVAFFAVRPHTELSIAEAVAAAGLQAPAGCRKKLKVRCEDCCAS